MWKIGCRVTNTVKKRKSGLLKTAALKLTLNLTKLLGQFSHGKKQSISVGIKEKNKVYKFAYVPCLAEECLAYCTPVGNGEGYILHIVLPRRSEN